MTERLSVAEIGDNAIKRAAFLLQKGGVVAIPTETVYGLAAAATNPAAIRKVFKAKGRPQDNPLIVHIAEIEQLSFVAKEIPETAFRCAKAFWPGPFTMILPRGENIPPEVSAGLDTVAVRLPAHPIACKIITACGIPLAAPSANSSGKPSPTSARHVMEDLDGKIDAVVFAGECAIGVESTVVTLCTNPPRLLRPGGVTVEQLRVILPNLVVDHAVLSEPKPGEKPVSPGMKYRHYAPKTKAVLVQGDSDAFAAFVNAKPHCAALCFAEEENKICCPKLCYGTRQDENTLAHDLFAVLRQADNLQAEVLYIHAPSKTGMGLAVYNRLIRATAFEIITLSDL